MTSCRRLHRRHRVSSLCERVKLFSNVPLAGEPQFKTNISVLEHVLADVKQELVKNMSVALYGIAKLKKRHHACSSN